MKLKIALSFLLIICLENINAQSECFQNCRQRSIDEWKILQTKGITSTDSALSIDNKIISDLKGCVFPETQLNKFDGGKLSIKELKGNVVFVHFWFTNCATCKAEMPSIDKLNKEYKKKDVKFLAISFNEKAKLETFFKKYGQFGSIQTYLDQKILENSFCILSGYPMNFILDKNGKVIDAWIEENPDPHNQENFYNKLKTLIDKNL